MRFVQFLFFRHALVYEDAEIIHWKFSHGQEEHGNRKTCMMTVRKILINYELCIFFKF